jgi:hypothetical protein
MQYMAERQLRSQTTLARLQQPCQQQLEVILLVEQYTLMVVPTLVGGK